MSQTPDYRQLLEQSLLEMRRMRAQLEAIEYARSEPIAVVGMGCRFPGDANTPEAFWSLLRDGVDAVGPVPASRWSADAYYDPTPGAAGKSYVREGGFLSEIDQFDPHFFGIAPREATSLDPQQRLLLEVTWEALEDAGIPAESLHGSQSGVFVGLFWDDYSPPRLYADTGVVDGYRMLSSLRGLAAGRLAYVLGLHGPTIQLDTACSSSLVAIHQACLSLRNQECNLALAGGVNLMLSPELTIAMCGMKALSPDGRCKAFDASADGFGRGEGCGIVVLKRFSDAQAAGDNILAVIRGSALNHDGRSNGLTVPSGVAQEAVIRQAHHNAGVAPEHIQYVETHGTGTPLGDPIELLALSQVMATPDRLPFAVGSVKGNIGHLESAGGVAAFMKVVLALQHGQIPPHLHFQTPNPHIPWDEIPVYVPTEPTPWPVAPRIAGINSFGMSGTNVHMVVAEAPPRPAQSARSSQPARHLLTLSAKSQPGLQALAARYAAFLTSHPDTDLADICYTARLGRSHFSHRLALQAENHSQFVSQLAGVAAGHPSDLAPVAPLSGSRRPKIAFLFTGHGAHYANMGRDLYQREPVFRSVIDSCDEILQDQLPTPLLEVLFPPPSAQPQPALLDTMTYGQPAIFALEMALAELWRSWGIEPDAVIGHSTGEFAAACFAGLFCLADGLRLIAARGRLMDSTPRGGQTVAVMAAAEEVEALLAEHPQVSLAAVNGPLNVVISGVQQAVQPLLAQLDRLGIKTKILSIPVAAHSALMDPILDSFAAAVEEITLAPPRLPLVSSMTGAVAGPELCTPGYWRQHLRRTVRFAAGVETLHSLGCTIFIETGPKPTLLQMVEPVLETRAAETGEPTVQPLLLPSLDPKVTDAQPILTSLAALYAQGVTIDWAAFEGDRTSQRRKVVLPTYPFQRQRYWSELPRPGRGGPALRPLIDQMTRSPRRKETIFETGVSLDSLPFLNDHRVYGQIVSPGAVQLAMVLHGVELALDGSQPSPQQPVALQEITFPAALVVAEEKEYPVQLLLSPPSAAGDGRGFDFEVLSLADSGAPSSETLTHLVGQIDGTAIPRFAADYQPASLAQAQAACQDARPVADLYGTIAAQQIALGPRFRWITGIWQGGDQVLGQFSLPEGVDDLAAYTLHPGLLDACFQLTVATYDRDTNGNPSGQETLVPFAIESVQVYAPNQGDGWWAHVQPAGQHKWHIRLFDAAGQPVADIQGFAVRSASQDAILRRARWQEWLYTVRWQPQPLPSVDTAATTGAGHLLILADGSGIGAQLAEQWRSRGGRATLVEMGQRFREQSGQRIEINPETPSDYAQLLQRLPDVTGLVYLAGRGQALAEGLDVASTRHALWLVQALVQAQKDHLPLWLVTWGAQAVQSGDRIDGLCQSPLWGLGKVLDLELPDLPCTRIDLDPRATDASAAGHLLAELLAEPLASSQPGVDGARENQIAYRQGERTVARLARAPRPSQTEPEPLTVGGDGVYLITGGLGGLGLLMADWLVEQGARHLLLMGRSQPTPGTAARLEKLRQRGAEIVVAQADVADEAAVARVLAAIRTPSGMGVSALRGVIHAAGVVDDGILAQQEWSRFERVFAAKVSGAWNLHRLTLTQGAPLDFFVLFSSVASLLGASGQANHAAANAFLDALAAWRRGQGLPGLSINWGGWSQIGYAAEQEAEQRRRRPALDFIGPEDGLRVFASLLRQPPPTGQIGVVPIHWSMWREASAFVSDLFASAGAETSAHDGLFRHQLDQAAQEARLGLLDTHVRGQVAKILGWQSPESIAPSDGFFQIGMDSLMAMQLRNALQTSLACQLPSTLTFKYPTVEELIAYLSEEVLDFASANGAGPDETEMESVSRRQSEFRSALSDELDELDEDELAALLADALDG